MDLIYNKKNTLICKATTEHAAVACHVIVASISEICGASGNYSSDFIEKWLENKTPENIEKWIKNSNHITYIAKYKNDVIGIIMATNQGNILLNYLLPTYLGNNVGQTLLATLENHFVQLNLKELSVSSTVTAKLFYQKSGFFISGDPITHGDKIIEYPMTKILT